MRMSRSRDRLQEQVGARAESVQTHFENADAKGNATRGHNARAVPIIFFAFAKQFRLQASCHWRTALRRPALYPVYPMFPWGLDYLFNPMFFGLRRSRVALLSGLDSVR